MGDGPNDLGSSRFHLLDACDASLRRLGTDYIDLYQLHGFDAVTPVEETLRALDDLVRAGKVRYIGCSNFSGWHLMKSLAASESYGWSRYVAHQAYYSLVSREYEWELMPLALDQKVGTIVWSPLGWGRLTGKLRRGQPPPEVSRLPKTAANGPPVVGRASLHGRRRARRGREGDRQDACRRSRSTGCCSGRPSPTSSSARATSSSCARTSGALGWNLTATRSRGSMPPAPSHPSIPYWHQRAEFGDRNPPPV